MDQRFDRLETKVDKISEDITEIKISTATNTASLQEHMKNNAELKEQTRILHERLKPVEVVVDRVKFAGGAFVVLVGAAVGVSKTGLLAYLLSLFGG